MVGLTGVAFATSAPELAVSLQAAIDGKGDIAVGNVVGSNISNILLVLGSSAIVAPLTVVRQIVRLDVPMMIATAGLAYAVSLDGMVSRGEGMVMLGLLAVYLMTAIRASGAISTSDVVVATRPIYKDVGLVLAGVATLVLGAQWLVDGAVAMARILGINELIIGLTVIAVGTSLPELATSIMATQRGQREIAVGNIVGSNIFNILAVLGLTAIFAPSGLQVPAAALAFDYPVMIAASVACLPILVRQHEIARWKGGVFFGYYIAYTVYLMLNAAQHAALSLYSKVMLWFVIPLTVLTVLTTIVRELRQRPTAP